MDYVDCYICNGTGIDEASWDGRCFWCHGDGLVEAGDFALDEDEDRHDDDEDA